MKVDPTVCVSKHKSMRSAQRSPRAEKILISSFEVSSPVNHFKRCCFILFLIFDEKSNRLSEFISSHLFYLIIIR